MTPAPAAPPGPRCWIGSYASTDTIGSIAGATVDPDTGALLPQGESLPAPNASYLTRSRDGVVYAVLENDRGEVCAFTSGPDGSPRRLGEPRSTGGAHPCHLSVDPSRRYVLSANYGSGSVAVHPIAADGSLAEASDVVEHRGSGPDNGPGGRQTGPHAHMVAGRRDHDGRWQVLVTDLGIDRIVRYRLDGDAGRLTMLDEIAMPAGSGPRHLAVQDRYAYVAGELDSTVTVVDLDAEGAEPRILATTSTTESDEASFPSAIRLSPDGRRCYVANRGPDTIAVLAVDEARVRLEAEVPALGAQPRDLTLSPDGRMLYVANQASDTVRSFRIDPGSGVPAATGAALSIRQPSCVLL